MADAVAILDGKTPEEAFVEALSKPGARLLVHPDDVERLLGPKALAVPLTIAGVAFTGVEVQVSWWAPRGRLTVLGRTPEESPSVLPSVLLASGACRTAEAVRKDVPL